MFIAELFNGAPKAPNEQPESHIDESAQPKLVVLYPGRFQPFHLGHCDVFNTLSAKFGRDNVYISTSNKTEAGRSPFSFADKMIFMIAAGIPVDRILEVKSPYKLPEQFDAENTILIDVVGAPDADRLRPGTYKKDGQPGYYQKFESIDKCETADKHGYVLIAAERKKTVTIAGKTYDASHGTEVRKLWNSIRNKPQQRAEFVTQMFGSPDPEIARLLDKIDLNEDSNMLVAVDSTSPIHGGINESQEDDLFAPPRIEPKDEHEAIAMWKRLYPKSKRISHRDKLVPESTLFDLLGIHPEPLRLFHFSQSNWMARADWGTDGYKNANGTISVLDHYETGYGEYYYIGARDTATLKAALQILYDNDAIETPEQRRERIAAQAQSRLTTASSKGIKLGSRIRWGNQVGEVVGFTKGGKVNIKLMWHDGNPYIASHSAATIKKSDVINEEDKFAPSNRVADNIKRSKHPFADLGVDFDDYEQVIDLIDHCAIVVNTNPADSNEMAEIFMWTLGQKYGGAQVCDLIEGVIQGYRSINDNETIALLHRALEKDWLQTGEKPFKAVNNLIVVLGKALYAVEDASGEQSLKPWGRDHDINEDDLFADSKTDKVSKALLGYAAELKSDYEAADSSWEDHWSQKRVIDKIDYAKRLAEKFRGPNGMIRALNIIAVNLNDRDAPMFKREAIWEADDYIQDKIGFGWAELFQTYEDELDESEVA